MSRSSKFFYFFILSSALLGFSLYSCGDKKQHKDVKEQHLDKDGFVQIFDGKTLNHWEGDPTYWRVENGNLVGEVTPETLLDNNTFIIWNGGQPEDFELKLEYRISENGNSGINYRSEHLDSLPYALKGYQADIDGKNQYTGQNYEEKKRTTLAYPGEKVIVPSRNDFNKETSLDLNIKNNAWQGREVVSKLGKLDSLKANIKSNDWNKVHLIIKGNRLQHYINGALMSDVTDKDSVNQSFKGFLGVQVHVGPPMKVEFRNIWLKTLEKN